MAAGLLERKQFVLHPQGSARLTLADYELKMDGQFGPQICWKFDSNKLMPPKEGSTQRLPFRQHYYTSTEYSPDPRNKLGIVLRALGVDVDQPKFDPKKLDLDDLMGRVVEAMITHAADKQGTMRANITGLVPYAPEEEGAAAPSPAARGKAAPQPSLEPVDDSDDPFENQ
jgi:hypothetical protein